MENEEKQIEEKDDNQDYIEAIKKLKEESVDRDKYDKLREENKKLLDSLVNGDEIAAASTKKEVDVDQLRKDLYGEDSDLSNLEYVSKTLELRDALMEKGARDPFLPYGPYCDASAEDIEKAQNVADVLTDCVEYAEGDNSVFTVELQRRMNDLRLPTRRNKR